MKRKKKWLIVVLTAVAAATAVGAELRVLPEPLAVVAELLLAGVEPAPPAM